MNRPGSNRRPPTKITKHKSFSKFCSSFQKKVLEEFGDSLHYFAESSLIEEYKPLCLKSREEPIVSKTFCFLENTNFGWCTLWLDEPDSTVVQCEFHFAEHGSARFSFPRGLEWGKRHAFVFDAQISNKWWAIQRGIDKVNEINRMAGKGLAMAIQTTRKLINAVEEQSYKNDGLTGTVVAVIKNWNQSPNSKKNLYNPFLPDTDHYPERAPSPEAAQMEAELYRSLVNHRANYETIAKKAP